VKLDEEDGMKAACAINLHNAVTVSQNGHADALAPAGRNAGTVRYN